MIKNEGKNREEEVSLEGVTGSDLTRIAQSWSSSLVFP